MFMFKSLSSHIQSRLRGIIIFLCTLALGAVLSVITQSPIWINIAFWFLIGGSIWLVLSSPSIASRVIKSTKRLGKVPYSLCSKKYGLSLAVLIIVILIPFMVPYWQSTLSIFIPSNAYALWTTEP